MDFNCKNCGVEFSDEIIKERKYCSPECYHNYRSNFWAKVKKGIYCWEWQGAKDKDGYGKFSLKSLRTHRYSWVMHFGKIPKGVFVLHHCDNPSCVRPSHLWLGTHQDNMDDMRRKGRENFAKGEGHSQAKITNKVVRKIRELSKRPELTQEKIGEMFGISQTQTGRIIRKKLWRHV